MERRYFNRGALICTLLIFLFSFNTSAQVGIGTIDPDSNAKLDITSTAAEPGGLLLPRVALVRTTDPDPLTGTVTAGMAVYNTANQNDVTPGYYYHDGTVWVRLAAASVASDDWKLTGNIGTTPGTGTNQNYLGTRDNRAMIIASNNSERLRVLANGQVSVNATTPLAGDRFTVQGAVNEYAINGYATGNTGVGVYGENNTNSANAYGVYGASAGAGNGVRGTNNASGQGVIGFSLLAGVGTQGQNSGTGYGMAAFNTSANTGGGLYVQSNNVGINTSMIANGGIGENISFNNKNGTGVNVAANPAGGINASGDVWAFAGDVKTKTPTVTNVVGGVILGNQNGRGVGTFMIHNGPQGRNGDFTALNLQNTEPNLVALNKNRSTSVLGQNISEVNIGGIVTVADFGYFGTDVDDHIGVSGYSTPDFLYGIGVEGIGGWYGVHGIENSFGFGYGVFSTGDFGGTGAKYFVIDDPLDPANKILKHASIESNEILNLYRGTETFDSNGSVVVKMPDYYDAINKNPSYQLTPVGASMPNLYVEKEINNGTFVIAGGVPGKKVSWSLTAERNDPFLQQHPEKRNMSVDKGSRRGKYLMPELYGQPREKSFSYQVPKKLEINKGSLVSETALDQNTLVNPSPSTFSTQLKVQGASSSEEVKEPTQSENNLSETNINSPTKTLETQETN